jgi:hypothetical protein
VELAQTELLEVLLEELAVLVAVELVQGLFQVLQVLLQVQVVAVVDRQPHLLCAIRASTVVVVVAQEVIVRP